MLSRRNFVKALSCFFAGVAASAGLAWSPLVAPPAEKEIDPDSDDIDIVDAKNMVFHDGVSDPYVDPEVRPIELTKDGYRVADVEKAYELVRETSTDHQKSMLAGGIVAPL